LIERGQYEIGWWVNAFGAVLKEEQAAELLRRCEEDIAKRPLPALRGRLRSERERAAAVFEMIALEACAQLGRVEYEDPAGGPDLKLWLSQDRFLWIEISYLYPRFEDEERKSRVVQNWVEGKGIAIGFKGSIRCDFFGDPDNWAGPVRTLPRLHEKRIFFQDPDVRSFFDRLRAPIIESFSVRLRRWSICLTASPDASLFSVSSAPLMEAPRNLQEHAVYRKLLNKAKQHKVDAPRVLCIGSDTSHALREESPAVLIGRKRAVEGALHSRGSISATIAVEITGVHAATGEWRRTAKIHVYPAGESSTRFPLTQQELDLLGRLDFNRWRYTHALPRHIAKVPPYMKRVDNRLSIESLADGSVKLRIPGPELQEALAGRQSLVHDDSSSDCPYGEYLSHLLGSGWRIAECRLIEGDVAKGWSELVELKLVPYECVYSPFGV
jgi:hypothetical protein